MAQPTNTQATNDMVGIREDLANIIKNVSPVDVPFYSSVKHVTASNVLCEWQTDSLAAAAANAAVEGDDATASAASPTVLLNNRTQISDKVASTSGTANSVNTAGRAKEIDYQMMKKGKELKRDIEKSIMDNKAKVAGNDTLGRQTAGVPTWIVDNISEASDATTATGDGTDIHTDGTARAFTEDQLKTVLKSCFDNGGEPNVLMVGAFNRQIASSFSSGSTVNQKAEDEALHKSFSVYESDFGDLKIIPNRFMEARTALCLQMDTWELGFLPGRSMKTIDLAKSGDSERRQVLSEYVVKGLAPIANGGIYDLTVS